MSRAGVRYMYLEMILLYMDRWNRLDCHAMNFNYVNMMYVATIGITTCTKGTKELLVHISTLGWKSIAVVTLKVIPALLMFIYQ